MCVFFLGVLCPVCPSVSGLYSVSAGAGVSVRCVQQSWVCQCVCVHMCVCFIILSGIQLHALIILSYSLPSPNLLELKLWNFQ